jgi:ribosomal protein S27AE
MTQGFAMSFYNSQAWQQCRNGFMQSKYFICERCGGVAVIAHHKKHITPENINDLNITLDWNNLRAVCIECHNIEHGGSALCSEDLTFDSDGNLKKI